jgi:hypothetical protein
MDRENQPSALKLKLIDIRIESVGIEIGVAQLSPTVRLQQKGSIRGGQIELLPAGNDKSAVVPNTHLPLSVRSARLLSGIRDLG